MAFLRLLIKRADIAWVACFFSNNIIMPDADLSFDR